MNDLAFESFISDMIGDVNHNDLLDGVVYEEDFTNQQMIRLLTEFVFMLEVEKKRLIK